MAACDDGKDDSAGGGTAGDDSATPVDDSGTEKPDDCGKVDDSGKTDDSGGCDEIEWFQDVDTDGYGAGAATLACKSPGADWVETSGDCDDSLAEVNPAATETCNTIDDDCDTAIDDDDDSVEAITWYSDGDGDGYGDPAGKSFTSCTGAGGYAPDDAKHPPDCDDADDTVFPGAPELCDDLQQNCDTTSWSGDAGVATWYPSTGGYEDWTADMLAGKYGAAATIDIEDDGELVICDGTWYVGLNVSRTGSAFDVTITGFHGAELTIISGGDDARPLSVLRDNSVVVAQGLTLIEGNACYGSAVSTAVVSMCSSAGASAGWSSNVSLTLADMRIEDNLPTLPAVATIVASEGMLTLDNTTVTDNNQGAIWSVNNLITCIGDAKTDAGIWGNTAGIFSLSFLKTPLLIESNGCDFDGSGGTYTPYYDVELQNLLDVEDFEFGDNALFLCDSTSLACARLAAPRRRAPFHIEEVSMIAFIVWLAACDDGKDDTAGGGTPADDSVAPDDSGTEKPDDSGTGPDDSGDDSGGCDRDRMVPGRRHGRLRRWPGDALVHGTRCRLGGGRRRLRRHPRRGEPGGGRDVQ